ncbi:MAG: ribokinase [Candidatus Omnitrophica bacterium]|nr:ribokinase [Candidatus Omnitrophota bacterium]
MNSQIAVIGSLNADFVINLERFPVAGETLIGRDFKVFPGGKGANQAYGVARLGGRVSMIGQVGNDAQADWLIANLAAAGVDTAQVRRDPTVASGVALIAIDAAGQNQIIIVPGANGNFGLDQLKASRETIASAGLVLLQLEIPMPTVEAAARLAKESGAVVIFDPAPARPISDELLAGADYVTPNETELAILTGVPPSDFTLAEALGKARELRARGAKKVLVKMGAKGALLVGDGMEHHWPAMPVTAVDTTAAGDAFNAAFAFALAEGQTELEAGRFATAAAACSVTRPGAQPSMPTREEVQAMLRITSQTVESHGLGIIV